MIRDHLFNLEEALDLIFLTQSITKEMVQQYWGVAITIQVFSQLHFFILHQMIILLVDLLKLAIDSLSIWVENSLHRLTLTNHPNLMMILWVWSVIVTSLSEVQLQVRWSRTSNSSPNSNKISNNNNPIILSKDNRMEMGTMEQLRIAPCKFWILQISSSIIILVIVSD